MATQESRLGSLITALGVDYKLLREQCMVFNALDPIAVRTGTKAWVMKGAGKLVVVKGNLTTAGATALVLDLNKNGTTVFTSTKISFSTGTVLTVGGFSTDTFADGDEYTVDIDSFTGSPAGCSLNIYYYRTS